VYLLGADQFQEVASRDRDRAIFKWLATSAPGRNDVFVSVLAIGILSHSIEDLDNPERDNWRRRVSEARQQFNATGSVIDVDQSIVDVWATLRGLSFNYDDGEPVGDDELLIVATAIARDLTLVTQVQGYHREIADRTTLKLVEP
jgi:predicted nucleic acid-binding protein